MVKQHSDRSKNKSTAQQAILLLGSNIGEPVKNLRKAKKLVEKSCGKISGVSSLYATAPWGDIAQDDFLNAVLVIDTSLSPRQLLNTILDIENKMGRVRKEKFGPRLIDIDILFYGDEIVDETGLSIPHPLMQERKFVLVPLAEVAAEKIHPVLLQNIHQLLTKCKDEQDVTKINMSL